MTQPEPEDEFDRRTIFIPAGHAGNATIKEARDEGWQQTATAREADGRFRIELQRPKGYVPPVGAAAGTPVAKSQPLNTALGLVLLVAIAAFVVYFAIQLFSKDDDTAAPAAQPMTSTEYDAGRCGKMADAFEKYRVEKLVPIVNAGTSAGPGSFRAITPDTEEVLKTFDKWNTGMRSPSLAAKFNTAITSGRTFIAVAQGSSSANTIASSAAEFIGDAQDAFTACPKS